MKILINILLFFPLFVHSQSAITFQGEFEKNEGILLVWDYNLARDTVTANIAKHAQKVAKVWIIYYPGQAPMDTVEIRSFLNRLGATNHNISFIPAWTETLWIRDFGPFTAYASFEGEIPERFVYDAGYSNFNRPKDDSIPSQLANLWQWNNESIDLELEGGNILLDGLKYGFATKRIFEQNPNLTEDEIGLMLEDYFNIEEFVFLDNLNNSGGGIWKHIDMFMCIADYETIFVSSYPDSLPDYSIIEQNVNQLESLTNAFGEQFNIVRIPAPPKADGTFATTQNDEMRTYANSIILNGIVLVPSYSMPEYDTVAERIYKENLPGYQIFMVDSRALTPLYGSLHCIIKEIPQENFLRIIHKKIEGSQFYEPDLTIRCLASTFTSINEMWLYYRMNGEPEFTKTTVHLELPEHYAIIENILPTDTFEYYLEAITDFDTLTYPITAPEGSFKFWFNIVGQSEYKVNNEKILVTPNPSNGNFIISGIETIKYEISIFDLNGKMIFKSEISNNNIDLKSILQTGVYILKVKTEYHILSTKVIVN